MIKKIVFHSMVKASNYFGLAGVRFYNEVGKMIPLTPLVSNTNTKSVFENGVTVEGNVACYNTSYYYGYAFDTSKTQVPTNTTQNQWMGNKADPQITITFPDNVIVGGISKIEYNTSFQSNKRLTSFSISAYNEDDTLLGTYDVTPMGGQSNIVEEVITDKFTKTYTTDTPQLIVSNDKSGLTQIPEISRIRFICNEPAGTKVRFAFSFDSRKTWYIYRDGIWKTIECNEKTLDIEGMTSSEVNQLTSTMFQAIQKQPNQNPDTLDYAISLSTSEVNRTPSISQIQISCTKIVTKYN